MGPESGKERHCVRTLIVSFVLMLLTENPAVALGEQAIDSPKPFPSSLKSSATGKIVGSVRFLGRFERPKPFLVYKNRNFCGARVTNESLLLNGNGGIKNVVITIRGASKTVWEPSNTILLDNKYCMFVPHVQVAPLGSEVLLHNSDPILHDVHARLNSETLFNVGLPSWRQVRKRLTRPGIITIECEVLHTWMSAYIVVTPSPYFAVTDENGQFAIFGVPVGNYEVEFWHEKLGRLSRRVAVEEEHSSVIDVVFTLP